MAQLPCSTPCTGNTSTSQFSPHTSWTTAGKIILLGCSSPTTVLHTNVHSWPSFTGSARASDKHFNVRRCGRSVYSPAVPPRVGSFLLRFSRPLTFYLPSRKPWEISLAYYPRNYSIYRATAAAATQTDLITQLCLVPLQQSLKKT